MHTSQGAAKPALSQDSARPKLIRYAQPLTPAEQIVLDRLPNFNRESLVTLDPGTGMYPLEINLAGTTKHSRHCKATFSRRDWSCHRCCELMKGSAPRKGWQQAFFARKLGQLQRRLPW